MASSMAQVEPLPLVPAGMMVGQRNASCMRSLTARTRSRPMSIWVSAWRDSSSASQSGKVVGKFCIRCCSGGGNEEAAAGCDSCGSSLQSIKQSGDDVGRLALQQGQQARDFLAHLAAVDDHVYGALLDQELGTLEAFRQLFAHGV